MKNTKDSPGVYIPPPLIYIAFFFLSFFLHQQLPIKGAFFFHSPTANIIGLIIILAGLFIAVPALLLFFKSKNTVVLIKPANSLQTTGIYKVSRNPMYVSLLFIYTGMAFIFGNWWTFILLPLLVVIIRYRIILPEERYLDRAFGKSYSDYKKNVRRWI
jgi:protein-S-isoprenylcysteine O-methyltransferase Ste14